jgi:hypothetical protein
MAVVASDARNVGVDVLRAVSLHGVVGMVQPKWQDSRQRYSRRRQRRAGLKREQEQKQVQEQQSSSGWN